MFLIFKMWNLQNIRVTDLDSEKYGNISFAVQGDDASCFQVSDDSTVQNVRVRLLCQPNYAVQPQYSFEVYGNDCAIK